MFIITIFSNFLLWCLIFYWLFMTALYCNSPRSLSSCFSNMLLACPKFGFITWTPSAGYLMYNCAWRICIDERISNEAPKPSSAVHDRRQRRDGGCDLGRMKEMIGSSIEGARAFQWALVRTIVPRRIACLLSPIRTNLRKSVAFLPIKMHTRITIQARMRIRGTACNSLQRYFHKAGSAVWCDTQLQ